jgi:SAM-dependent methyltransferase
MGKRGVPVSDSTEVTACRLCSGELRVALCLGGSPLANEYQDGPEQGEEFPLCMMQCTTCKHYQLGVSVNPERLFREYAYESGLTETFRAHLETLAKLLVDRFKPALVLEIGSNDGHLLRSLHSHGVRSIGIEASERLVQLANAQKLCCIQGFWPAQRYTEQPNLIVANNVFAHVPDVRGFTEAVRDALKPDGVFVFEVQYLFEQARKLLIGNVYHEHLDYWTLTALIPFLKRCGLNLFDVQLINTYGGSIRGFASKDERAATPLVDFMLSAEAEMKIRPEWRLMHARDVVRNYMSGMSGDLYGYGCPAKATTLISLSGQAHRFRALFDDATAKIGRYSPHGIPILPGSALLDVQPERVLLFSANFEWEIKARYPGFKGEWVLV